MKKAEFIKELSRRTNYTQVAIGEVFNVARDIIIEELSKGEDIPIVKGVTIYSKQREEATKFNALLNREITVPAAIVPKVKFTQSFKDDINNK